MGLTNSMGWKRDALRKREIGKQGDTGREENVELRSRES
jgi:hypothetical protein